MSIKICKDNYEEEFGSFSLYSPNNITLSDFQKYSCHAIYHGHNSLVVAGTGSGKTLSVNYAIEHFKSKNKRIIYTSPIKALSNQKYHEFSKKYPDVSFGIITGDIKCNPDADCVIMTCEILRNTLKQNMNGTEQGCLVSLENVACVVFDEVHYINDPERGTVWEETIIMLRNYSCSLVMLSATIDCPENFAEWVSNITKRDTWISGFQKRFVPLKHYSLLVITDKMKKHNELKNESLGDIVLTEIQDPDNNFLSNNYERVYNVLNKIEKTKIILSKNFIINETVKYLHNNNMLPAIYFNLSKHGVLLCAESISHNLNESINLDVNKECRAILSKLPNYKDYMELPEYIKLIGLISKGVAYHHSGLLSIFREMVEILFEKGLIKILFATETFSVGLNMPTKTVIFDSMNKFDGLYFRNLRSHEYTQMAGRAGRRSIDTIGYVIHLNQLYRDPISKGIYKEIMSGQALRVVSKFKIDYHFVLENGTSLFEHTMLYKEITKEKEQLQLQIKNLEDAVSSSVSNSVSNSIKNKLSQKQKKQLLKAVPLETTQEQKIKNELISLKTDLYNIENYYKTMYDSIKNILDTNNFTKDLKKRNIALVIKEIHPLILTDLLLYFEAIESVDKHLLASFLATLCSDHEEFIYTSDKDKDKDLNSYEIETINKIKDLYEKYTEIEFNSAVFKNNYKMFKDWTLTSTKEECQILIGSCNETQIGLFLKMLLKLNNLVQELMKLENVIDISLLHAISKVPEITMKYIVSNQSLYI
jgi:replicative superfamily II helicase